jgi:hypothetical protein
VAGDGLASGRAAPQVLLPGELIVRESA